MNKKADISIIILVLGVIAVCGLAILSFYSSEISVKKDFIGLEMIEKINSLAEEVKFYEDPEINEDSFKIMEIFSEEISKDNIVFRGTKLKEGYSLTGDYSIKECSLFWFLDCEDKRIVFIEYNK